MTDRMIVGSKLLIALYISTLLLLAAGCAQLSSPPQLSPIGDIAFYATRAIQGVAALQQMAIDAEAAKAMTATDARTIITATKVAGQAGVNLSVALKAGASAETAKGQAVAAIKQALTDVPEQLSPHARDLTEPYIQVVLIALTVFGGV